MSGAWRQNDDRQRVLDATDIVRLVGDHLSLKAKGREYVGLCPFHNDRTPSMFVVPHKQLFHCFSCGAGGNALDFVMRFHGMGFREALTFLAERAGIELTPFKPERVSAGHADHEGGTGGGVTKDELVQANAFALSFFRTILRHPEHGAAARAVVEQRGLSAEMVERFQIGAAPDRWDGLLKTVESRGMRVEPFVAAGLLKRRENGGGLYDALRNRLIFPILDQIGRPIAFGGRKINPEDEPKYLNSPETALFNKSATLFALPQAFRAIQNARCAVITEGYMDAIACHQAGFENVVATLGTALTARHASVLRRLCDRVVLLFDADEAGQNAADRALEVFFPELIDVMVMSLPGGKDPDDVLKTEEGPEVFRRQLKGAADMLDFRFERRAESMKARGATPGSATHTRMIQEDLEHLVQIGLNEVSPLRRQAVISRYARMAGVAEHVIVRTLSGVRARAPRAAEPGGVSGTAAAGAGDSEPRRPESAAGEALACVLAFPSLASSHGDDTRAVCEELVVGGGAAGAIASWVLERVDGGESPSVEALLGTHDSAAVRSLAAAWASHAERCAGTDQGAIVEAFEAAALRVRQVRTGREFASLSSAPRAGVDSLQSLIEARRRGEALGVSPVLVPGVARAAGAGPPPDR